MSIRVAGLSRDTIYHYRLCADDAGAGPACGPARRLRTQDVACGETITTDVRLTGDLDCSFDSPGPVVGPGGIVIGAASLEVNLGGHDLRGPIFSGGGGPNGIDNTAGHDDVTVQNGSLGNWGDGVHIEGGSRNEVRGVSVMGARYGVSSTGGSGNRVLSADVLGRTTGISIEDESGFVVSHSSVRNGGFGSPAMVIDGTEARVARSDFGSSGFGSGVMVMGTGNRIVGNTIRRPDPGLTTGIVVLSGADNVVAENEVSGAFVVIPGDTEGSVGDGIFVGPLANGTVLRDNYSHDNEGDGLEIQSAATRLRDNRADGNGDLGIQAVAGVTDLGGNSASGNGNPLQCVNVFCQ